MQIKKTLIAYYSRRGQNLVNGTVKSLRVGNTELAAAMIQKYTGAVCFRIEPYEDYPDDYYQCIDLARQDLRQGKRPKLKNCPECLAQYNMIFQNAFYLEAMRYRAKPATRFAENTIGDCYGTGQGRESGQSAGGGRRLLRQSVTYSILKI